MPAAYRIRHTLLILLTAIGTILTAAGMSTLAQNPAVAPSLRTPPPSCTPIRGDGLYAGPICPIRWQPAVPRRRGIGHKVESEAIDPVLSKLATEYSSLPFVRLYCQPLPRDMYGWADMNAFEMGLRRREHCKPLHVLADGGLVVPTRTAIGLLTMAHELWHLMGVFSEPQAECRAIQTVDDLAAFITGDRLLGKALQALALPDSRSLRRARIGYSAPRKCRPNGAWDMTPGDGVWPG